MAVEQARFVKKQAYTKYFPQVRFTGFGYYAVNPLVSFDAKDIQSADIRDLYEAIYELVSEDTDLDDDLNLMKKGLSGSVSAIQPIYTGGRIKYGNHLADLGVQAAQLYSEMKERDVVEDVESTFYLVVGLKEKGSTLDAALSLIDSLDRVVASALANGLVTRADALQLELKRNEIKALEQQYKSGVRLSRRLLCSQIGIPYSESIDFEQPSNLAPPRLEFVYRDCGDSLRPEMQLLKLNLDAAQTMKKMTIGESLPQLAVSGIGFYGNAIHKHYEGNAVAMLSLIIPISDWWATSYKIQRHDVAIEQARLMQENYANLMSLEEEKAYSDMVDAWMLVRSDSAALDIAVENYRLANLNYQSGNMTLSEVLQAHALLLQAQNALTDRRVSYIIARRRLLDLRRSDYK